MIVRKAAGLRCMRSSGVTRRAVWYSHGLFEQTFSLSLFHPFWITGANEERVGCPFPGSGVQMASRRDLLSSGARGPQALFLHDVPQLTQIGLGDGIIWF